MGNVLIAISNYYDLLYLLNIEFLLNKEINICYLLKHNFSYEDINELKKLKLKYQLSFIETFDEIDYVNDIIVSNYNELFFNKICEISKIYNSNIIIINNNENQQYESKYFIDTLNEMKNKTIVLVGGISNVNVQINFELFLKNKFISNDVNVLSIYSEENIDKNSLTINDLMLAYKDDYVANMNIRKKVMEKDLILIGLPYDISNLQTSLSYYFPILVSLINPDCFILTLIDDYNKKYLEHIAYMYKRKIDVIVPMGFKQKTVFNDGVKKLSVYKTINIKKRLSLFNKRFEQVLNCITLPKEIIKINLSNKD